MRVKCLCVDKDTCSWLARHCVRRVRTDVSDLTVHIRVLLYRRNIGTSRQATDVGIIISISIIIIISVVIIIIFFFFFIITITLPRVCTLTDFV